MRCRVTVIAMILLAVGSTCSGRAQDPEAKIAPREINTAPIKDMVSHLSDACAGDGSGAGISDSRVLIAFSVDPDGSLPKSGLKISHSSGSKVMDIAALGLLWKLGKSSILGAFSDLSTTTIEFKVEAGVTRLTIAGAAQSAKEAGAKASRLRFMFNLLNLSQQNKNQIAADLLGRFVIGTDDKNVIADMSLSCATLSEILRQTDAPK